MFKNVTTIIFTDLPSRICKHKKTFLSNPVSLEKLFRVNYFEKNRNLIKSYI